jgi:hypothetical protein
MAAKQADAGTLTQIRRLATGSRCVRITRTAEYDLMAHRLKKADVCDEIIDWIDIGRAVKEITLHSFPGLVGQPGYEIKPRMKGILFYVKFALVGLGNPGEYMLIVSAHPDH